MNECLIRDIFFVGLSDRVLQKRLNTPDLTLAKTLEIYRSKAVVTKQVLQIQQPAGKNLIIQQEPSVDLIKRRNTKGNNSNSDQNFSKSESQYCGFRHKFPAYVKVCAKCKQKIILLECVKSISIDESVNPVVCPLRRIPHAMLPKVKVELYKMVSVGIMKKWRSPLDGLIKWQSS